MKISNYFIQDKKISKAIAETMDDLSANQNYFLSKQTKKERQRDLELPGSSVLRVAQDRFRWRSEALTDLITGPPLLPPAKSLPEPYPSSKHPRTSTALPPEDQCLVPRRHGRAPPKTNSDPKIKANRSELLMILEQRLVISP